MECKHLEDAVDISPTFVKKLMEGNRNMWTCAQCASDQSPWMCLFCGSVLCGRYVNGHCKSHGEANENHFVCIDTSLAVYCYKCDDFVINDTDTGTIELIRKALLTDKPQFGEQRKRKKGAELDDLNSKKLRSNSKENVAVVSPGTVTQVGLRNLGNTCFMNAILQSLSSIKDFSAYFKELPAFEWGDKRSGTAVKKYYTRRYQPNGSSLVEELRKILCGLWQGTEKSISPDALFSVVWKVVPRFRGFQQHDAHEFMLYILNHCHSELLQSSQYSNGIDTIVSGTFGGEMQSDVTCLKCGTISVKKETCLDLSLDIPMKCKDKIATSGSSKGKGSKSKEKAKVCTLMDCLERFVQVEELDESEWYTCAKCGKNEPSTKKFWLMQLPNVLVMHLKRFRYSDTGGRTKVDTFVRFPIKDLNMNPYVLKTKIHKYSEKANLYDLSAVVVHHGSGAGSGHYTTYARHGGTWYHFNDSTVSHINEDAIVHCKGYILFYTRQYPEVNVIGRLKCGTRQ